MSTVEVSNVTKSFGQVRAVDGVSFDVRQGEIFGLLGPNGAGKTTTIRLMLDIFKPDSGTVSILDGPMTEAKKNRIGYMPEERGLYQDLTLENCLVYLATLKGLTPSDARRRVGVYLQRFDLAGQSRSKVKTLSKGMQQKAQLINTIIHQPELVIVDEPFAALDPVNTLMVKDLIRELRDRGTAILMSTHQMHHVEELCDRIMLINQGKALLYGSVENIRRRFSGNIVVLRAAGELPAVAGIKSVVSRNHAVRLELAEGAKPKDILRSLVERDVDVEQFEVALPSLDEIFVRVVAKRGVS
jgi:ABC-2 type transport system ATP-binding protein